MFLYDYIRNLEGYKTNEKANESLYEEINLRKFQILSHIKLWERNNFNHSDSFYYAYNDCYSYYSGSSVILTEKIRIELGSFHNYLDREKRKIHGYTLRTIKIDNKMLDFKFQETCQDLM